MKKISAFIFTLLLIGISTKSSAQKYSRLLSIGYTGGYPIGGINNFITNKNFDGLTIDGRYFVKDNISIGFATGWSSFKNQLPRQIYQTENGEISATQTRYLRNIPLLVSAHYYFGKEGAKVIPYVGGGLGAFLTTYEKWYGTVPNAPTQWSFGIRPEAGIMFL